MNDPILLPQDQHIIISALRHCRESQSLLLRRTTRWVTEHWEELNIRTRAQLIQDVELDLHIRAELTLEERALLARERPDWNSYLNFIEWKMNE
ncbi:MULTISPECIES: hypothetical protein [Corynebacterium]|jgi:hypothetical protein|uniref:hypothetical protein n=1 Tax=Corynebacterium TaxID=1716 RepID=UPI001EF457BE|nr:MULTISPECIES: hypothetical protein [Corynebacterium]MCG7232756.1 hypothetical protein [Corynebacterium sp. ACRPR]MCG7270669.1 hypothetical protein [Corynebacterium sp. ACRQM]MDK8660256.1 hypothetical protein [Corynebacterium sp. MSK204]WKS60295.1 hypothetical protein NLL43_11045 [Corynebacterium accolens]